MTITYVDEGTRASREGFLQVGCNECKCMQDIPKPPPNEDVTVFQCVRCEAINTVRHNQAEWAKAQFVSGCILRLVLVACALALLGAVAFVTWLFL